MDPNRVWEDVKEDIELLWEMVNDKEYAKRVSWADGSTVEEVRGTLTTNLEALTSWLKKGGFPPQKA